MKAPGDPDENVELLDALSDPGFTPKVRDVTRVAALYEHADDALVEVIDRAISRAADRAIAPLTRAFEGFPPRVRSRVCRVLSKMEGEAVRDFLLRALADTDPKTRRNAVIGLGRQKDSLVESALLAVAAEDPPIEQKRSLAASLGKVGGPASAAWLRQVSSDDPEFCRIREKALLMLERTSKRHAPSKVLMSKRPQAPLEVDLFCRRGLEECVIEELGPGYESRVERSGVVGATVTGPLADLLRVRTAISFSFPFRPRPLAGDDIEVISSAIAAREVRQLLAHFTEGPTRYRLSFAEGGHKRALVWAVAKRVAEIAPELINDPTDSTWELTVRRGSRGISVEAAPRAFDDSRFAYRVTDVPAASHPTIAAALALEARVRPGDVIWDPFVGSATELIECSLCAEDVTLLGSDHDPAALVQARANLKAANVTATLVESDALRFSPAGVTLIVTNPPLGRRVAREASLGPLLDALVDHAADLLVPGGRLVWLAPFAERSRARGEQAGLYLEMARDVDMGGFTAELQVWTKQELR